MTVILTAAQMRAIETAAIESGTVTGLELMECAGRGVIQAVFKEWPELQAAPHKAIVLCGPGNNGGDGFVVARLLHNWGWSVDVFLYGDAAKLPPDARTNFDRWCELGPFGSVLGDFDKRTPVEEFDLVVDALFGTGLARPLEDLSQVLSYLKDTAGAHSQTTKRDHSGSSVPRVVSIDIPSGLDADSGRPLQPSHSGPGASAANLTVSFHQMKRGHVLADGARLSGKTVVADIGLSKDLGPGSSTHHALSQLHGLSENGSEQTLARHMVRILNSSLLSEDLLKDSTGHKYDHGHALVVSGSMGRTGAARLSARGALRVGAGLVTVAAPGNAMMECAAQLTAIMLRRCDNGTDLAGLLKDARFNALCLGPGLGVTAETRELVQVALQASRGVVLDADALTSFADEPEALFAQTRNSKTVLTPHGGEFAQLFPDLDAKLVAPPTKGPAYSRVDATREAAARAGCVVLLKGPDTIIADRDGVCSVNAACYARAAPWLATAGSGDVLAGLITGLLARGLSNLEAAEAAAWLHVEAARAFGPGLVAEDLPEMLPRVFRELENR